MVAGGLKHIIQELGFFETLEGGRFISSFAIGMGCANELRLWFLDMGGNQDE